LGETRLDHVTNQDITQQCGIQPIGEWILKLRADRDNHISRMTEDRIVRVEITYQKEEEVPEDPRSAGPTPFLQETCSQPNGKKERKKERKEERRRSIGPKVRSFIRGDKPIVFRS
jgi:hypothetical protein